MRPRLLTTVFAIILVTCSTLLAETKIDISGQMRVRAELSKTNYVGLAGPKFDPFLRSRVAVTATRDTNLHVLVEFQDSRTFEFESNSEISSPRRGSTGGVVVRQAFISINSIHGSSFGLKVGRFEFSHGNERLLGTNNWDNIGATWNGAELNYSKGKFAANGFVFAGPDTSDIYEYTVAGGAVDFRSIGVSPLLLYENIEEYDDGLRPSTQRFTVAAFGSHQFGGINASYNFAFQSGRLDTKYWIQVYAGGEWHSEPILERVDIEAWLATLHLSGCVPIARDFEWSIGVDISSGDGQILRSTSTEFVAPFRSFGDFRGKELFVGTRPLAYSHARSNGLVELLARIEYGIDKPIQLATTVHHFSTQRGFKAFIAQTTPYAGALTRLEGVHELGWQFDLEARTSVEDGLLWQLGLSLFLPTDKMASTFDYDPGYYAYSQMTVDF